MKMIFFTKKEVLPVIAVCIGIILSDALANRQARPSKLPKTPPMQFNRNNLRFPGHSKNTKQIDHFRKKILPPPKHAPKIKEKQFLVPVARPRPVGFFNNNLARAFLIPAIPTLIGKQVYIICVTCHFPLIQLQVLVWHLHSLSHKLEELMLMFQVLVLQKQM